jgi:hypothetical protein
VVSAVRVYILCGWLMTQLERTGGKLVLPAKLHELSCMQHMHWCLPALLSCGESCGVHMFQLLKLSCAHVCACLFACTCVNKARLT